MHSFFTKKGRATKIGAIGGAFQGLGNITTGVMDALAETGCSAYDSFGTMVAICSGDKYENISETGKAIDYGQLTTSEVYMGMVGYASTLGTSEYMYATVDWAYGNIDTDEYAKRIGTNAPFQAAMASGVRIVKVSPGELAPKTSLASTLKPNTSPPPVPVVKPSPAPAAPKSPVGGLETRGYKPKPGERTLNGYVEQNTRNGEIGLQTSSPGFDMTPGSTQFKRFGADAHGGVQPHVHQPIRNQTPVGARGSTGTKTKNGGVTQPTEKDVKQLYDYLNNGKYP